MALEREPNESRLSEAELEPWRKLLPVATQTDGWERKLWFILTSPIDTWDWKRFEIQKHLRQQVALIPELTTTELRWAYMQELVATLANEAALREAPIARSMAGLRRRVGRAVIERIVPGAFAEKEAERDRRRKRPEPEAPGPLWASRLPKPSDTRKLLIARAIIDAQLAHPDWSMVQCQLEALAVVGNRNPAARIKFTDLPAHTQDLIKVKLSHPTISNVEASKRLGLSRGYAGKALFDLRKRWNRHTLLNLARQAEEELVRTQNGNTPPPI
jgi:hypothetical protein